MSIIQDCKYGVTHISEMKAAGTTGKAECEAAGASSVDAKAGVEASTQAVTTKASLFKGQAAAIDADIAKTTELIKNENGQIAVNNKEIDDLQKALDTSDGTGSGENSAFSLTVGGGTGDAPPVGKDGKPTSKGKTSGQPAGDDNSGKQDRIAVLTSNNDSLQQTVTTNNAKVTQQTTSKNAAIDALVKDAQQHKKADLAVQDETNKQGEKVNKNIAAGGTITNISAGVGIAGGIAKTIGARMIAQGTALAAATAGSAAPAGAAMIATGTITVNAGIGAGIAGTTGGVVGSAVTNAGQKADAQLVSTGTSIASGVISVEASISELSSMKTTTPETELPDASGKKPGERDLKKDLGMDP